jgi:hypothetical protein
VPSELLTRQVTASGTFPSPLGTRMLKGRLFAGPFSYALAPAASLEASEGRGQPDSATIASA